MVALRKRIACACGCKGWCSHSVVFRFVHWCVQALVDAKYPTRRHDGKEFCSDVDAKRKDMAGEKLKLPAFIMYVRGDWSEYCGTFGFPNWASTMRPCLYCSASSESLSNFSGLSPLTFPHRENSDADFDTAARRCEIWVSVSAELHEVLKRELRFDKRKQGNRGLTLLNDIAGTPLRSGDRLEPNDGLADVVEFFNLATFPIRVCFWRRSEETLVHHSNPLWDEGLGVTPARSLTVDVLHTLHLGVFQQWCKHNVWLLLESSAWQKTSTTMEERHKQNVLCIRNELDNWYKDRHKEKPEEFLTRVHDLTVKMFGSRTDPAMKLSGTETWGFLLFLVNALEMHKAHLPPEEARLREAGAELQKLYEEMQVCGASPTLTRAQAERGWGYPTANVSHDLASHPRSGIMFGI